MPARTAWRKAKRRWAKAWKAWGRGLFVVLAVMIPFRSSVADWNHVPTGSMRPSILEGDRVLVNKLAYDLKVPLTSWRVACWGRPERGDIVVFLSPVNEVRLIKRVVGLPGDVVALRQNVLIVTGKPARYATLDDATSEAIPLPERTFHGLASERLGDHRHPVMTTPSRPALRTWGPVRVPEAHYLVLGDNRDDSADSRYFGCVAQGRILGRVCRVFYSLDRDGCYLPRAGRWFRRLR